MGHAKKRIIPNKKDRPMFFIVSVFDNISLTLQYIQYPIIIRKYRINSVVIISLAKGFLNAIIKMYDNIKITVATNVPIVM
jgi:hypothetical protein